MSQPPAELKWIIAMDLTRLTCPTCGDVGTCRVDLRSAGGFEFVPVLSCQSCPFETIGVIYGNHAMFPELTGRD